MNPQTNNSPAGNQNTFFGQKISIPGINVNNAGDNQLIMQDNYNTRTYYNSSGNPVTQIGKLPAGGYGIRFPDSNGIGIAQFGTFPSGSTGLRVAKPGIEVANATNSQLIFNSSQDMLKIVQSGTGTIPSSATTTSGLTIAHNLGFIPSFQAYALISGSYNNFPIVNFFAGGGLASTYSANTDINNINFYVQVPTGSTISSSTSIKYYLFQETAN